MNNQTEEKETIDIFRIETVNNKYFTYPQDEFQTIVPTGETQNPFIMSIHKKTGEWELLPFGSIIRITYTQVDKVRYDRVRPKDRL